MPDTVTENHGSTQDGNRVSNSINSSITGESSLGSESSVPTTDTPSQDQPIIIRVTQDYHKIKSSGASGVSTNANQSSTVIIYAIAINETSSAPEISSPAFATSNQSPIISLREDISGQSDTTDPNVVVQPISAGSVQEINFGDTSNTENTVH